MLVYLLIQQFSSSVHFHSTNLFDTNQRAVALYQVLYYQDIIRFFFVRVEKFYRKLSRSNSKQLLPPHSLCSANKPLSLEHWLVSSIDDCLFFSLGLNQVFKSLKLCVISAQQATKSNVRSLDPLGVLNQVIV